MGTGKAIRRRAKLMKVANQGNLHKAARGRASAQMPLPPAPTQDDYNDKLPASLSRMMALKAAAAAPAKRPKVEEASQRHASRPQGGQQFQLKQQQQEQQQEQREAPNTPGAAHGKAAGMGAVSGKAATTAQAGGSSNQPGGPIWEQPKKLKQRKKEYLNAKKLKKKGRKGATDEDHMVDKPAFGEVVHQPPKVHLKRKHWDPAAAASTQQLAGSRAQKQLQQHQQQRKQLQQLQGKPAKAQQDDPELKELREAVIEGYRAARGPRVGHATLDSLKKLAQ